MKADVTKADIVAGVRALGIKPGDRLVVHSSLSSFGHVIGGAPAVVEALLESVGSAGLLMMPTYARKKDDNGDLLAHGFENERVSTGTIPATFARHPRAFRGHNPLYSITCAGEGAQELARENGQLMFPYGDDQQYRVFLQSGGYVLLIGVGERVNSSIHAVEEMYDPPYLQQKKSQSHLEVDEFFAMPLAQRRGSLKHHNTRPKRDFTRVSQLLKDAHILRQACIGKAVLTLEPGWQLKRILLEALQEDVNFMVVDEASA